MFIDFLINKELFNPFMAAFEQDTEKGNPVTLDAYLESRGPENWVFDAFSWKGDTKCVWLNLHMDWLDKLESLATRKLKVYIVGAVSSDKQWRRKFQSAKDKLKGKYITMTPLTYPEGLSQKEYMMLSVQNVFIADIVVALPDWVNSPGATAEVHLAQSIKTKVMDFDELVTGVGSIYGTPGNGKTAILPKRMAE